MNKKDRKFLIIGLIFLIFDIIILVDYYIVGTIIGVSIIIIFLVSTLKKRDFLSLTNGLEKR